MSQIISDRINKQDLLRDIDDVIPAPDQWLREENQQLGGRRPKDMIEADENQRRMVHDLIQAIKHGMTT